MNKQMHTCILQSIEFMKERKNINNINTERRNIKKRMKEQNMKINEKMKKKKERKKL